MKNKHFTHGWKKYQVIVVCAINENNNKQFTLIKTLFILEMCTSFDGLH